MFIRFLFVCLLSFMQFSCLSWPKGEQDQIIARVGSRYLYSSDLEKQILPNMSSSDSTLIVQNIINTWAKRHLLYDQALLNLDPTEQDALDQLIEDYRLDLWSRSYKEKVVESRIPTDVSMEKIVAYYEKTKDNFKLKEDIIQIRYLVVSQDIQDLEMIEENFISESEESRAFLDSLDYQFKAHMLEDSIWFNKHDFLKLFPVIPAKDFKKYLKKSQFFTFKDSLEVYLLMVTDFRLHNDVVPFPMVEKTIKKIVFNRTKLEYIKQFDQEILQDAIQTNTFEIYP